MSISSACRVLVVVGLASLASVACGGAGSGAPDSADSDVTKSAKPLTDAELAAAFAKAPASLSEKQGKQLIDATINPVATTARLKMLNDFIASRSSSETGGYLASAMEGIFWATPRDFVSKPAGLGGQTLRTTVAVESGTAGPTRVEVNGVAAASYDLELTISGFHVVVGKVPAGSSAVDTAKLIAKAIDAANEKIMSTIEDHKSFDVIGGDHAESQSGVDDLEISTSGAVVVILVAQNG